MVDVDKMKWMEINKKRDYIEKRILTYIEGKTGLDVYQNYIPETIDIEDELYQLAIEQQKYPSGWLEKQRELRNIEITNPITYTKNKYITNNLVHGDLYIDWEPEYPNHYRQPTYNSKGIPSDTKFMKFDVKIGTFISAKSLTSFKGNFYMLIPNGDIDDISNVRVINRRTIKSYYNKSGARLDRYTGTKGLRLGKPLRKECTLDEFCIRLVKARLCNLSLREVNDYNNDIFNFGENA